MTHLVDQIVDAIVDLLTDSTCARSNVARDRAPVLDVREELPAIVVHVGEDEPELKQFAQGPWRSTVQIDVELYATADEGDVSRVLLQMRLESHREILSVDRLLLPGVNLVLPGPAEGIKRVSDSAIPTGYLRTSYFVSYQHSRTDPSQ